MHNLTEFILAGLGLLVLLAGFLIAVAHAKVRAHQRECEAHDGVCPPLPPHGLGIHIERHIHRETYRADTRRGTNGLYRNGLI